MLHHRGTVDFDALAVPPASAIVERSTEGWRKLVSPGVVLEWNSRFADVASADGVLALASGRTPDAGPGGEAERWLLRYAQRGLAAADEVGGAFAAAIIDARQSRVLLFVDRFSIEPLCYAAHGRTLSFSNSACDVRPGPPDIDAQALYDYLYFHFVPSPYTAFANVFRLPPAHRVVASVAGAERVPYWTPSFIENDDRDLEGRKREFRNLVEAAVREAAYDPTTACFLSGGTDSSTVAGMLTRIRGEPVHAFSIGFKAEGYDEMAYARVAARHFGLKHHEHYLTPEEVVRAIPRVAASLDQPFGNSSILPTYFCALNAREHGFTRMLAGDGGDELFGGNSRYATQSLFGLYDRLPRGARARIEGPVTRWRLFRSIAGFRQLGGYVRHARVPMPDRLYTFNLLQHLEDDGLFEPSFRSAIEPRHPIAHQRSTWAALTADTLLNRMLAYDWKLTLADNDLPKVRNASELADVTVGFPFLDRALTEFSLTIPPSWKLKGLRLRWFFKEALRDFLPAEILRKKKHGFGLPFGPWLLQHGALRRLAEDSLDAISKRGIVRHSFTRDLMAKRLPEAPGYYGEMVWVLMMLEQWMRGRNTSLPSPDTSEADAKPPVVSLTR